VSGTDRKGYIGVYEFSRQTGLSLSYIYQQIYLGKIKAEKLGRKWQIPVSEVQRANEP
jgi:excisionase family DNA binding protein